jgi:micrococcal nuclease
MKRRFLGAAATVIAASAIAGYAGASSTSVRLVHVTSPVSAGSYATLVARVAPSRSCSITVYYYSGPSHAAGLYSKRPVSGRVSWTWKVGTRTTPGRWPISVRCGSAGTLRTSFRTT